MKEKQFYFIIGLVLILAITIPYIYAAQTGGAEHIFGGFLMNTQDGNSYLAKMYQGWRGNWRFTLPYTADPGEGGYIFLFYLGLGHVARILNVPLLLVFHVTRILGAMCMLWALAHFYETLFPSPQRRKLAFAISALASGLGWLAIPFGAFASDFWVAETYPFLSAYSNPHFALGLALIVWMVTPRTEKRPFLFFAASLALAIMSPFGVVIVGLALGSVWLSTQDFQGLKDFRSLRDFGSLGPDFWNLLAAGLGGVPVLLYQYWLSHTDPILMGWDAQNLTLTPPVWDVFLALSPVFVLALLGVRQAWAKKNTKILILWAGLGLALIFIPWNLQRRFMMGLYIPLAGLAALGIESLGQKIKLKYRTLVIILFTLALPTNLMVIFSGFYAAQTRDPQVYFTAGEEQAFAWVEANTHPSALILTDSETGLYIPARTGRRVIYGHPYETVNAIKEKEAVTLFFSGTMTTAQSEAFLHTRSVDYIFVGPREHYPLPKGEVPGVRPEEWLEMGVELLFSNTAVQIYGVLP